MRIRNADDLGHYLRDRRRAAGLTQTDLAARARVSRRWLVGAIEEHVKRCRTVLG